MTYRINPFIKVFVSEKLLHELKGTKKISDKDVFSMKSDTRKVLVFLVNKLLEKSPLGMLLLETLNGKP